MKIKQFCMRFIVRCALIVVVITGIGLFMYSPYIVEKFWRGKSITVFAWAQVLNADFVHEFEQKTGAKVYIRYFENNEELLVKLEKSNDHGYDLIMASDFAGEQLIKNGKLKSIDKTKLNFLHHLHPKLLSHYYDPDNRYSIPFFWGALVLGVDTDYFKDGLPPASWDLIFDKNVAPSRIGLFEDSRQLIILASYYLFKKVEDLTPTQAHLVAHLLQQQRSWVYMYTDMRGEYLLASHSCPVVPIWSADIVKVMRDFEHINFVVPQEGTFAVIDSFFIPQATDNDELVYEFLNYLYQPKILQQYVDMFGFYPATTNVHPSFVREGVSVAPDDMLTNVHFFKNVISESTLNTIWLSFKS